MASAAACRFRVSSVAVQNNIRGQEMRHIRLTAVSGDAFAASGKLGEGQPDASPVGDIAMLVNPAFGKKFSLGDEFTVTFQERD